MRLVFVSNFFNHHQKPLSDAFASTPGVEFVFLETKPISEERLKLGWGTEDRPDYVKANYVSEESAVECQRLVDEADVVIFGDAPYRMVTRRLREKKLTFLYHERIYKRTYPWYELVYRFPRNFAMYTRHRNLHLLAAGAYTAADYARTGSFRGKAYQWGYFPEVKEYSCVASLMAQKKENSILWASRFLDWKHPEIPVKLARRLKEEGYNFELNMIGDGGLLEQMRQYVREQGVEDCVHLLGSVKQQQVRRYMESSEIFLFTSDRMEGWGAVANEAMNSACAMVASHAIGSVPFLVENGRNGLIYRDGDLEDAYQKMKWLLDHPDDRTQLGRNAYLTVKNQWKPSIAAERFLTIAGELLSGNRITKYDSGVCSKAGYLKDTWILESGVVWG